MREISCYQDGEALLRSLQARGSSVARFRSLPGAAGQIGPLVWLKLLEQLRTTFPQIEVDAWLDCAGDAGYVLAALNEGCKAICFSGPEEVLHKLQEIAAQHGARVLQRSDLETDFSGR